jgi:hypothetical protein
VRRNISNGMKLALAPTDKIAVAEKMSNGCNKALSL